MQIVVKITTFVIIYFSISFIILISKSGANFND